MRLRSSYEGTTSGLEAATQEGQQLALVATPQGTVRCPWDQVMPTGSKVLVSIRPEYVAVEFETRWLRFVDDAEFLLDPAAHVIHVRSKSRLGRKDFGVNRARVEALRRKLDLQ